MKLLDLEYSHDSESVGEMYSFQWKCISIYDQLHNSLRLLLTCWTVTRNVTITTVGTKTNPFPVHLFFNQRTISIWFNNSAHSCWIIDIHPKCAVEELKISRSRRVKWVKIWLSDENLLFSDIHRKTNEHRPSMKSLNYFWFQFSWAL